MTRTSSMTAPRSAAAQTALLFGGALALALFAAPAARAAGAQTAAAPAPAPAAQTAIDAKPVVSEPQASIPFADHGGIRNWHVLDRDTVLIEGSGRQWYRAKLIGPCFDLPFAERIGFKTDTSGSFDRYSTLIVRGQRCPLISLTKSDPPPKKQKGKPTLEQAQNPVKPAMETGLEPK